MCTIPFAIETFFAWELDNVQIFKPKEKQKC